MSQLRRYFWIFSKWMAFSPARVADCWRKLGADIGEGTLVFRNVRFGRGGRDPITIGKHCVLTGCRILGHDASTNAYLGTLPKGVSIAKRVTIEDDCFIGYGAIVLMGVRIGHGSIVGAGAVVTKDVPPGVVVAGNPAKVISTVEALVEKRRKEFLGQGDPGDSPA